MWRAGLAGMIAFIASLAVHFVVLPPAAPTIARSLGSPLVEAERRIVQALEARERDHGVWQHVSGQLLRSDDPVGALAQLNSRLPESAQREMAATGFTGYYLGFALMRWDRRPEAVRAWEAALSSFRSWDAGTLASERAWLRGYDRLYEARTLMRLARHEEAAAALERLDLLESPSAEFTIAIARTCAEIGLEQRAAELFREALGTHEDDAIRDWMPRHTYRARTWRDSTGEPMAARELLLALAEEVRRRIDARSAPEEMETIHSSLHTLGHHLLISGCEKEARAVWRLGVREGIDRATGPDERYAWLWVAKNRALLDEPAGVAEALEKAAAAGGLDPEGLVRDPDLSRQFDHRTVRAAVLLHGTPRQWLDEAQAESPS